MTKVNEKGYGALEASVWSVRILPTRQLLGVDQLVDRTVWVREVVGSSPTT